MSAPQFPEHCNVCRRDVFICLRCGKPSCMGGVTGCPGCKKARALDDAREKNAEHADLTRATGAKR